MNGDLRVVLLPSLLAVGILLIVLGRSRPANLRRARRQQDLRDWMVQAGVPGVSPGQLAAFCGAVGLICGFILLGLSGSLWIGLAIAVLVGYLPVMALRARRRRRSRELQEVWPDAIDNLASGIRAGLSLPEAVAGLAERGPELLRAPFARFADRYHATGRFNDALDSLKDELADPTADRVVEALRMAREVGGSELGRTLRTLAGFLRDEYRVRKEIEARQTWVVVAARMAYATPWVVLLLLSSRGEAAVAYRGAGGAVVIAAGAVMASVGYWWMLRISRIPGEERVLR
jgi:tight adherence protein B